MSKYYCIEIDPKGKKLDYEAQYYRKFDDRWNFEDIEISTRITSTGYTIEGCISIKELRKLGISDNFYLGVYRADYKSEKEEDVDWYSWIIPDSKEPDFHIPSALGKCFFQRKG